MKVCQRCGESKPYDDFYRYPRNRDGFFHICKVCWCKNTKRYRTENLDKVRERTTGYMRRWRASNPERFQQLRSAHYEVRQAIRRGELQRGVCEVCGNQKAHAHHDDYTKPLEVRWLCSTHHKVFHNDRNN